MSRISHTEISSPPRIWNTRTDVGMRTPAHGFRGSTASAASFRSLDGSIARPDAESFDPYTATALIAGVPGPSPTTSSPIVSSAA
jgi:hypothetical protein